MRARLRIDLTPLPQPRPRVYKTKDGDARAVSNTKEILEYKTAIQFEAKWAWRQPPATGPVGVILTLVLPRPKALRWKTKDMPREWHTHKPDLDNLEKAVLDALKGVYWVDDGQVCWVQKSKVIGSGGERPGLILEVFSLREKPK